MNGRRRTLGVLAVLAALAGCGAPASIGGGASGGGQDVGAGGTAVGSGGRSGGGAGGSAGDGAGGISGGGGIAAGGSGGTTGGGSGGVPIGASPYDCNWGAPVFTKLDSSLTPPGGLAVTNVPQFVSIGFDDNAFEDGMQWALDLLQSKRNPAGSGNPCTFDGTPARVTFFINSHVGITTDALKALHARVYTDGHEPANHTDSHADTLMQNPDKAVWTKEMTTCNDYLVGLGVPRARIVGFRTPFLQQSEATYQAIVEENFKFDCSVEHYNDGSGFVWPYTLDNGRDPKHTYMTPPAGKYPGLWEMPVNQLSEAATGYQAITGFDYNLWIVAKMSKQQVLDILKVNLILRMQGGMMPDAAPNRAPLLIGGHTDLYSAVNADANNVAATPFLERRAAISEFIDWALAYDPSVRIVPYGEVMHWMQAPVGLDGTKGK
ncbi:MAG TPA: polysaccharide deacetylase family protein [Polyangia bacterium]|nr:polysaccharide deacetylase family protein [Polyangia bacterium]